MHFSNCRKFYWITFSQTFLFEVVYYIMHACKKIKIGHCAKFRDKNKCFLQLLFPVRAILRRISTSGVMRAQLLILITHPLIFARFYWLLYVTWCKFTGRLSRNNPRLRRNLPSYYFNWKETKPAGKSQLKSFTFSSLLFYMEEKQTRFVDVQSCLYQKAGRKCCSGKYKNVNKTCCQRLWRCRKLRVDFQI